MGNTHPAAQYRDLIEVLDDDARWGNEPARLASEAIADLCAEIARLSEESDALRARVAELEARQTEADAAGFRRGVEAAAKVVEIDRNAYRLTGIVGVAEALTVAATAIRATLSEPRT